MNFLCKKGESVEMNVSDWDSQEQLFLVCVYNVSPDQDYTFLQVPVGSTSQDIVTQVWEILTCNVIHWPYGYPKFTIPKESTTDLPIFIYHGFKTH